MSFQVEIDPQAQEALQEAREGSGGKGFPPLPKGPYQATVVPLKKDGDRVKTEEWGGTGPNSKKQVVRVMVRIADGSPTGAKRHFSIRVPLFTRFAPKDGAPVGKPARMYFDFFGALGVSDEDLAAGRLPSVDQMMGKPIEIVLGEPEVPDQWNPLGSNEVNFVNKPSNSFASTPVRRPGVPVAPWLDANDNLLPEFVPVEQGQQQAGPAAPKRDPWSTPTAQDVADAQAQAVQPQGIQPGAWTNQPTY